MTHAAGILRLWQTCARRGHARRGRTLAKESKELDQHDVDDPELAAPGSRIALRSLSAFVSV